MRFSIDWEKIINDDEDPPAELMVTSAMDGEEHKEGLSNLSNTELTEKIRRLKRSLSGTIGARLSDGGKKLRANIKLHEGELERRQRVGSQKEFDGCMRHDSCSIGILQVSSYKQDLLWICVRVCVRVHGQLCGNQNCLICHFKLLYSSYYFKKDSLRVGSDVIGPDDFEPQASPSVSSPQSTFAACFLNKLEVKADSKTANAFQKELYALNPCDHKRTLNRQFSQRKHKRELLSQEAPYKFPVDKGESFLNVDLKGRDSSTTRYSEEKFSSCFLKKTKASQAQSSHTKRHANGEAVVLVDEEEPDANKAAERMDEVVECRNATKVYYPSRVDPESVEICCSDMESLAPEAYLSSTIMNFYIRYLQKTKAHADVVEYHFFNTYFYKKLKEAVLSKNEKEASFFKLRRWWKGVNIFEKAYIFLPIHEDLHWSLVIICIPDKEDKLGPSLLHLDSLGLHCSKSLFGTIRKFLEQEWKFLRQGEVSTLPFSDKIWENLPRRIDENVIPVPQQRNEYDCGLFVLFFMERFMEEVHGRLKKKDFVMFGRRWFKPEEASRLRMKIHNILKEEFKNASEA
ncbi:ubiquitin-like-specific protease 1D isoform X2 [Nicotiana tabacum]|uniref:Ubiquitin-like-specific protease 1D isoform X2 n=1 Tax=Nicotiana tabacum TaxID=4097 RepID=A0A1S4AM10_TOBAC|nr:PREDICTED: ubiquitin-like-specific protease 1D isoform X3 [Nicotiana tabacum]